MSDRPITCREREQWARALKYARLEADIAHRRIERERKDRKNRQMEIVLGAVLLLCLGVCLLMGAQAFINVGHWLEYGWQ